MLTPDEAVAYIQRHLGYLGSTELTTVIIEELNWEQRKHERNPELPRPWFLLTELASVDTKIDEDRLLLPSDFKAEYERGTLWRYDATLAEPWTELTKDDVDALRKKQPLLIALSGAPKYYARAGKYFILFPKPDAVYELRMQYYKEDDAIISGGLTNQWLTYAEDLIVNSAGLKVAKSLRDTEAVKYFTEDYLVARGAFLAEMESTDHDNRRYIMGD